MYTLYYSPGACSLAVHTVLEEIGAEFRLAKARQADGQKTPEMLKVNPRGSVPVLEDDGQIVREGGAILVYLLDKHKSPLLPREGKARAAALEWLMFCNATIHPAYSRIFFIKGAEIDEAAKQKLLEKTCEQIQGYWNEIESHLAQQPYLAGKECTAADILLTVIANWSFLPKPVQFGPNVTRLLKAVKARPSFQKALGTEQVEYKAAA